MIEIPISFTLKEKDNLTADLFGLGEKVTDPFVLKMLGDNARVANTEAEITEGVIIKRATGVKQPVMERSSFTEISTGERATGMH